MSAVYELLKREDERRNKVAVERLARAAYNAQWADEFDSLSKDSIDYALAIQIGNAVFAEMQTMVAEFSLLGSIFYRKAQ